MSEFPLIMTLIDDTKWIRAGTYQTTGHGIDGPLISPYNHGYFRGITRVTRLHAFIMSFREYKWKAPVSILPYESRTYYNRIDVSSAIKGSDGMKHFIQSIKLDSSINHIRVFVAAENGVKHQTGYQLLNTILDQHRNNKLTWWICYHSAQPISKKQPQFNECVMITPES